MVIKVYLSNISPLWPIERQNSVLKAHIDGYPDGIDIYKDILTPRERRAHQAESLGERAGLLRPTSRTRIRPENIIVASLAVFDWSEAGLVAALAAAATRGASITALDASLEIPPTAGAEIIQRAVAAFLAARKRIPDTAPGARGAMVWSKNREEKARAAAETIRAAWGRRDTKTAELLAFAGISLNTAKRYLGSRPIAQKAMDAAGKRKRAFRKVKR